MSQTESTLLRFTPSTLPGATGAWVGKSTLRLFVQTVQAPAQVAVSAVNGAWSEDSVTAATAPPLGAQVTVLAVTPADAGQWIDVDVTQLMRDWLNNAAVNDGIALSAPSWFQLSPWSR